MKNKPMKKKKVLSPESKRKQKAAIINYYIKKREKDKLRKTKE